MVVQISFLNFICSIYHCMSYNFQTYMLLCLIVSMFYVLTNKSTLFGRVLEILNDVIFLWQLTSALIKLILAFLVGIPYAKWLLLSSWYFLDSVAHVISYNMFLLNDTLILFSSSRLVLVCQLSCYCIVNLSALLIFICLRINLRR